MPHYAWKQIEPLPENPQSLDPVEMRPIYEAWWASKERLEESSGAALKEFNRRLIRRLSIETGILERLYDLDRGTTEALVTQGFVEDLVSRSSTDIEPSRLIDILSDQEAAIQLVMDCVSGNRPLTKGLMHELHSILTKHEDKTIALDQFGNRREIPLVKGKFKGLPNNPRRPDGDIHEYCPPEHVDAEIERLLGWISQYWDKDPVLVAAWLHHRFTQIHPYQDGNGRVARALTTLVLLRARLLPLVIDRDLRVEYIHALESADGGDLAPLGALFGRLERGAIMQALSVDADQEIAHQRSLSSLVIDNLAAKLGKRREQKDAELRKVNDVAIALRALARERLTANVQRLERALSTMAEPQINIANGGPDYQNAFWYKSDVIQSAKKSGKFANFSEDHFFLKFSVRLGGQRLGFVISFHHVGRELSGIMEATAFAHCRSQEDPDDREYTDEFFLCSLEPFVFTYRTNTREVGSAFEKWLDAAFAVAIKEYGDTL